MDGVDAILDRYETAPVQGWPRWVAEQIQAADYVIVVWTETYRKRFDGRTNEELGARWEGMVLTQVLYESGSENRKIISVVF
jgi:hypothetical protein